MRTIIFVAVLIMMATDAQSQKMPACNSKPVSIANQPAWAEVGRDLFYDPILSGNREVACATCHHPAFGTSDGVALSLGDGGIGLGPERRVNPENVPEQRIPRNAPALFNLGYDEFSVLFHDGRVERLPDGTIRTPLGPLTDTGPLATLTALSAFPVLSPDEMAGHYSENEISVAVRRGVLTGPGGAYDLLAARVEAIRGYRKRFTALSGPEPLTYAQIAYALGAFMALEWRADDSPFDRLICQGTPLPAKAEAGLKLFYGKAGCSTCHSGRFQTDHAFHAIGMIQIGPGKRERFETHAQDLGRQRVTGDENDAYRFRTPSLRNVTLTAPYGHAGAYHDLASVIRHHMNPKQALTAYSADKVWLPELPGAQDFRVLEDTREREALIASNELTPLELSDQEIAELVAFLGALTDRSGITGRMGIPETVPSGLAVPRP